MGVRLGADGASPDAFFQITLCSGRFGEKLGGRLPKSRFVLAYASTVSASRRGCTTSSQIPASIA